jgi:hypothetical protein
VEEGEMRESGRERRTKDWEKGKVWGGRYVINRYDVEILVSNLKLDVANRHN